MTKGPDAIAGSQPARLRRNGSSDCLRRRVSTRDQEVVLQFRTAESVRVEVVDRLGSRLKGAWVQGITSDGQWAFPGGVTDERGQFTLQLLPGAKYKVSTIYTDKRGNPYAAKLEGVSSDAGQIRLQVDTVMDCVDE